MIILLFFGLILLLGALVAAFVPPIEQYNGGTFSPRKYVVAPALVLGLLFVMLSSFRVVAPGQVGIPEVLGHVKAPIGPGFHVVNPFSSIHKMNLRTQTYTMSHTQGEGAKTADDSITVNSKDGAPLQVDATIVYHLEKSKASAVYREIGTSYTEILRSTARTAIRGNFGNYDAVPAATVQRREVSAAIESELQKSLGVRGVFVEAFQLRNVALPQGLLDSVSEKLKAQQDAEKQSFVLEQTKKQAEIRVAEAEGLAKAQGIIQSTLTKEYLQHEYIDTLKQTINSPNNTTVILPFDQNLTPMLPIGGGKAAG